MSKPTTPAQIKTRVRTLHLANSAQQIRLAKLPENACSLSVAVEAKEWIDLAPVEPIDRVVQPGRRVDVVSCGQRIVNVLGPPFFFEHAQNCLLIPRRHAKPFDDLGRQEQLPPNRIPTRLQSESRRRACERRSFARSGRGQYLRPP